MLSENDLRRVSVEKLSNRGNAGGIGDGGDVSCWFHAEHAHPALSKGLQHRTVVAGDFDEQIAGGPAVLSDQGVAEPLSMPADAFRGRRYVDVIAIQLLS